MSWITAGRSKTASSELERMPERVTEQAAASPCEPPGSGIRPPRAAGEAASEAPPSAVVRDAAGFDMVDYSQV